MYALFVEYISVYLLKRFKGLANSDDYNYNKITAK